MPPVSGGGGLGSPAQNSSAQSSYDVSLGVRISPDPNSAFDFHVNDYTIDCTTSPTVELAVAAPRSIGFKFLGSSGMAAPAPPYELRQHQYRQTMTLQPGQGFRFAIGQSSYSVRCLPADFPQLLVSQNGTPQAQWYVFAPTIGNTNGPYFLIITDARGTPVWWQRQAFSWAYDFKVLDSNRIAYYMPSGGNAYVIQDFSGRLLNTIADQLDDHDLQPTANGTYLGIRYVTRVCPPDCADMSAWGGSAQAGVIDAEIVELDQQSNVLWTWRTRDHIALRETGETTWFPNVGDDIIHMNAVEPDGTDGLMFSARHLNAVYHVTKSTGAIDWKIGGTPRPESLTVIGDVRPTAVGPNGQVLNGQHDIRKLPDGTISVHDNGTLANRPPSVMRYRLDLVNRTAEVVQEIHDARVSGSACCGSARLLPGGNWLVQWGASPFMTELDPDGNPVLTIEYNMGAMFSYRAVPVLPGVLAADTLRDGMDAMSSQ